MKISFPLLVAALAGSVPQLAAAVPIHATFNGTVSGSSAFGNVLSDFPIGTAASFNVTFDDAGLVDDAAQVTDYDVAPVSGWLRLGSLEWLFNAGRINTFSYMLGPGNPVTSYGVQLTGTGPTISDNGSIFGLFLSLTPDATPFGGFGPRVGFAYPVPSGTYFSYADLSGIFRTSSETSVPAPGPGLPMLGAVVLILFGRRRSGIVRKVLQVSVTRSSTTARIAHLPATAEFAAWRASHAPNQG
jgi:hypothetical protein